jgi:hypothetical protein
MALAHASHQLASCPDDAMVIEVDIPKPIPAVLRKAAYSMSPRSGADMDDALDNLLCWGIIRPSRLPLASPTILTYLKGKSCMCVHCRALNTFTIPISYPMPRIAENVLPLHGPTTFHAWTLITASPVAPESQSTISFSTHRGLFGYLRMPFGLNNAPAFFQGIMDRIIHAELREDGSESILTILSSFLRLLNCMSGISVQSSRA